MAASVRAAVEGGLRVYAECGGMLYLSMIGAIGLKWEMTKRLQRFGYVTVTDADGYLTWDTEHWSHLQGNKFIRTYELGGRTLRDFTHFNIYDMAEEFAGTMDRTFGQGASVALNIRPQGAAELRL